MKKNRPVLVTTANRGVFFGYLSKRSSASVTLLRGRNCICWRGLRGFIDLANSGPNTKCRVGAPGDIELFNVVSITEVTPEAVVKWESAPW